jgi:hypothetical protein
LKHQVFERYESILRAVQDNDIMLHFPYHTYDYVLRFLNEAALDPKVEEIKKRSKEIGDEILKVEPEIEELLKTFPPEVVQREKLNHKNKKSGKKYFNF